MGDLLGSQGIFYPPNFDFFRTKVSFSTATGVNTSKPRLYDFSFSTALFVPLPNQIGHSVLRPPSLTPRGNLPSAFELLPSVVSRDARNAELFLDQRVP